MKGICGHETDRLYKKPYGSQDKGWYCDSCILESCDMVNAGHLAEWDEESFKRERVTK